jgi:hypothetical protein
MTGFVPSEQRVASLQVGRLLSQHLRDAIAALHNADVPPSRGDAVGALACFRDSLLHRQRQEHVWGILAALRDIADCAIRLGDAHRAVRIHSFVDRLEREGNIFPTAETSAGGAPRESERDLVAARAVLGDEAFADQWEIGRAQTLAQAVDNALESLQADPG